MIPENQVAVINDRVYPIYESHISLEFDSVESMKNKGLGTYLYISAARFIHRLNSVLFSSSAHEDAAKAAWDRMTQFGWSGKISEPTKDFDVSSYPEQFSDSYGFKPPFLEKEELQFLDNKLNFPETFTF